MSTDLHHALERRVLLIAPTTRDSEVTRSLLAKVGLQCVACSGLRELACQMEAGAGVVLGLPPMSLLVRRRARGDLAEFRAKR